MKESAFEAYMVGRNLADKTRMQRGYALKRVERAHQIDLDQEFERDGLTELLKQFSYSAADARAQVPNPTKLDIEADKLLTHLRWYRSHVADYLRFKGGVAPDIAAEASQDSVDDIIEEIVGKTFALEKDLQIGLRRNLGQLEPGLEPVDGGNERKVDAGFIDILARDSHGILTVIELKADIARPEAVAQILGYMGCLAEETGEPVRGILVAGDHHARVVHASRAVPNLLLKRYRYRFEFE